jgi:predicted GH43/DUF377 family glycosyl hydrolase
MDSDPDGEPSRQQNHSPANPFERLAGFDFRYRPAMPREEGVTRRDPSPVIEVDGTYHVWYSRNEDAAHGFTATVYHATSEDGVEWTEQGEAIGRGGSGAFDECGVFTPTVLAAEDRYYLYYTAMPDRWRQYPQTTRGAIGVAVADSPSGPWTKHDGNPVLECSDDPDAFDSLRVDDACIVPRDGRYWLYYKGREWNESPRNTKMGVARSSDPLGPWTKHAENPVLESGHEVCVWPHGDGVGCLVSEIGPEGNTLQFSDDGLHFWKAADAMPPQAPGPYRRDAFEEGHGPGITWGLCIGGVASDWPYLLRFDCNLEPPRGDAAPDRD